MADPIFDDPPTLDAVRDIQNWRWPVFFPLAAALRRHLVDPIGVVPIPDQLREPPVMRGGGGALSWMAVTFEDGKERLLGPTTDMSLPVSKVVNDTRLKELLMSDWLKSRGS